MYIYVNSEYFDYYNYPFDFMKPKTTKVILEFNLFDHLKFLT